MLSYRLIAFLLSFSCLFACAQIDTQDYQGIWMGTITDRHCLNFTISLKSLGEQEYQLQIANTKPVIERDLRSQSEEWIQLQLDDRWQLELKPEDGGQGLTGFVKSGRFITRIQFQKEEADTYRGVWNPFMFDDSLISGDMFVYVEDNEDTPLAAYPFLGEQRLRGIWAGDFSRHGEQLWFEDSNTGFRFRASFGDQQIGLEMLLLDELITQIDLHPTDNEGEYDTDPVAKDQSADSPAQLDDGWEVSNIQEAG
ncbi:MAG: hypothetical protein AAFQ68_21830, partial [Bacteroidota bacterium]